MITNPGMQDNPFVKILVRVVNCIELGCGLDPFRTVRLSADSDGLVPIGLERGFVNVYSPWVVVSQFLVKVSLGHRPFASRRGAEPGALNNVF